MSSKNYIVEKFLKIMFCVINRMIQPQSRRKYSNYFILENQHAGLPTLFNENGSLALGGWCGSIAVQRAIETVSQS